MADYDARVVALYDGDNPDGPDHDFYRALAASASVRSIVDLGCGTGMLTVSLALDGRRVVGVDPSPAMLEHARTRPGGDRVEWLLGDSSAIPRGPFDLAVMTGNVAQHIPDPAWQATLRGLRSVLSDGGLLAFESHNPAARAWDGWAVPEPEATTRATPVGRLREWAEVEEQSSDRVLLRFHTLFLDPTAADPTEKVLEELVLTFRDHEQLARQLREAGFAVVNLSGDWHGTPFDGTQPLIVVTAVAAAILEDVEAGGELPDHPPQP